METCFTVRMSKPKLKNYVDPELTSEVVRRCKFRTHQESRTSIFADCSKPDGICILKGPLIMPKELI